MKQKNYLRGFLLAFKKRPDLKNKMDGSATNREQKFFAVALLVLWLLIFLLINHKHLTIK